MDNIKTEIIRSQLPKAMTKLANRKIFAGEYTVNNFIEINNIDRYRGKAKKLIHNIYLSIMKATGLKE